MYNVLLKGFKTKEQAEEFISWYGHVGEQHFSDWLECKEDELNMSAANVDYSIVSVPKWNEDVFQAYLEIFERDY